MLDQKLTVVVHRVAAVPMGGSGFDCQMTVASDALNPAIMPGMNCEMKSIPYKKSDALTVPPKAVFTEDLDPFKQYVYLVGKEGAGKDGKPTEADSDARRAE